MLGIIRCRDLKVCPAFSTNKSEQVMKMWRWACLSLFAVSVATPTIEAAAQSAAGEAQSIILVRHAETIASKQRELSPVGTRRAQELATVLKDAGITGIIITDTRRARETAAPLVKATGIVPQIFQLPDRTAAAAHRMQHRESVAAAIRSHTGKSILVVGHETTVPAIISILGGPKLPNICSTVHDSLFILLPGHLSSKLIVARYGAYTACNS
jgi:phosphohistidine phosphatase SixA